MINKTLLPDEIVIDSLYTLFYQEKPNGYFFPGEIHPFWELIYVDKGKINLLLDGNEFILGPGDLVFYSENQNHIFWTDKNTAPNFLTISFDMSFVGKDFFKDKIFKTDTRIKDIFSNILRIRSHAFEGDIYTHHVGVRENSELLRQYIKVLLIELLLYLYVDFNHKSSSNHRLVDDPNCIHHIVKKGISFIQTHIMNRIYVDEICSHVAASRSTFTRLFKENTGMSVVTYINIEKLKKSRQLLRELDISITFIAELLGFSSVYYFSNLFKKEYGISPIEYRKSINKTYEKIVN
jgi:AraC-like DNA-binding protein/quercetin dioxygenase-like cupin family protein